MTRVTQDQGNPGQEPANAGEPGTESTPGQPGSAPGQPGYGTQPQPGHGGSYSTQPQPDYGGAQTPPPPPGYGAQPGYGTQPGYGAQPGYGSQPGYGVPPGQPYGSTAPYSSPYQAYPGSGYQQYRQKDPSLAEWWQRLLARIIDGIIVGAVVLAILIPAFVSLVHRIQNVNNQYLDINSPAAQTALNHAISQSIGAFYLASLAAVVIAMVYDWVQHALWGQTLGKRALGTRVVRADTRSKIGAGPAAGRAAVYAFPALVPFVGGLFGLLNELWLTWDPQRQCLHDKAARTVVVKTRGPYAPPWPGPAASGQPYG